MSLRPGDMLHCPHLLVFPRHVKSSGIHVLVDLTRIMGQWIWVRCICIMCGMKFTEVYVWSAHTNTASFIARLICAGQAHSWPPITRAAIWSGKIYISTAYSRSHNSRSRVAQLNKRISIHVYDFIFSNIFTAAFASAMEKPRFRNPSCNV